MNFSHFAWRGKRARVALACVVLLVACYGLASSMWSVQAQVSVADECLILADENLAAYSARAFWHEHCRSSDTPNSSRSVFYQYVVPAGEWREVQAELSSGGTFGEIRLYDAEFELIDESFDGFWRPNATLMDNLSAGTYYFEILACDREDCIVDEPTFVYTFKIAFRTISNGENSCVQTFRFGVIEDDNVNVACLYGNDAFDPAVSVYGGYSFELTENTLIEVTAHPSSFLYLVDSNNQGVRASTNFNATGELYNLSAGEYTLNVLRHPDSATAVGFNLLVARFGADLNDAFAPIIGGVEVGISNGGRCTLGFFANVDAPPNSAVIDDTSGLVVNSHCTENQGTADNTQLTQGGVPITQPVAVRASSDSTEREFLTGELLDSQIYTDATPTAAFIREYDKLHCIPACSYSDASFFELAQGVNTADRIARPQNRNTLISHQFERQFSFNRQQFNREYLTIDPNRPYFTIVGVAEAQIGDIVHKVGATTGWTTGWVLGVCENKRINDADHGSILEYCQSRFDSRVNNVVAASGDSGSPVFVCAERADFNCASGNVLLVGILHSVANSGQVGGVVYGESANFSPLSNIVGEFSGDADLCWSFVSGDACLTPAPSANECPVTAIALGELVRGNWDTDCRGIDQQQNLFARHYAIDLPAGTRFAVSTTYEFGNPQLFLLNGNDVRFEGLYGNVLATGDSALEYELGEFENERFVIELTSDTALGEFRLIVNDRDATDDTTPPTPNEPAVQRPPEPMDANVPPPPTPTPPDMVSPPAPQIPPTDLTPAPETPDLARILGFGALAGIVLIIVVAAGVLYVILRKSRIW